MSGERQVVFITGEPGIGKTAVVDTFLLGIRDFRSPILDPSPWIGRGQCVEHYGTGEAYLPVLEALGQLSRQPDGEHLEDSGLLLEAHFILGNSLFWLGELARARRHLEQGLALYDPQQHAAHAFQYGQDPGVGCRCFLAATLAIQG
ncbi:MAG: hypothetical protein HYZ50_06170 [Deltaproteobacteria bacterium]|nr:hypothetical protein [Deltaproteobacteria bacterium]